MNDSKSRVSPEALNIDLPQIGPDEAFHFCCGPSQPCFNRCCAELTLPLTPYDVARLRRNLGLDGADFLRAFADIRSAPDSGFPLPLLRMIESPDAPCPFVTPAGCSVYDDRPGACRLFPLGRGAKIASSGAKEIFYLMREEKCLGFNCGQTWTPREWTQNEGAEIYNHFNDRYGRVIGMILAGGRPLTGRQSGLALVCLYQLEHFKALVDKMDLFGRLRVPRDRQIKIMENSRAGDSALLDFALDWIELALFGVSPNLDTPKKTWIEKKYFS